MQQDLKPCLSGVNRRHLVAGAIGAIARRRLFLDITLTGGVLANEALKLFK